jgi:hypothetical protein
VDEAAVSQNGGGGRSFYIDRKVGQHPALGLWKCSRDKGQRRKSDERVPEAAEAIDKDPSGRRWHDLFLVCLLQSNGATLLTASLIESSWK